MKPGDLVKTSIGHLILEDRVLLDPPAHQWEPGWWAYPETVDPDDEDAEMYFISDDGIVYANSAQWTDVYDIQVGTI